MAKKHGESKRIMYFCDMKSIILKILAIAGVILVTLLFIVGAGVVLLNTDSFQNKLLRKATAMLSEKLSTKVEIDSIHIGFFEDDIRLFGLEIEYLQRRKMLEVNQLGVEIRLFDLLRQEVNIDEITLSGIKANIYKPKPDSAANYQFVLDAFKKEKKDSTKVTTEKKEKTKLAVDLNHVLIEDVAVTYNDNHFSLAQLLYKKGLMGNQEAEIRDLHTSWVHVKKKDSTRVDNQLTLGVVRVTGNLQEQQVEIDGLQYQTDNHLPHKRTGKPHRGWFDADHLKVIAHLKATLNHADKDSIVGMLTECEVEDLTSKFHITDLHCGFRQQGEHVHLSDVTVGMENTKLTFAGGDIQMPSKKQDRPFLFSTTVITGTTLLTDISHPFAPVLKDFRLPLWLSTKFSGTDSSLVFRDVVVKTTDNNLIVKASGGIDGLKDKYKLNVHFNVHQMVAKGNSKARIINQFPVKKFMMKQLHALGTLYYTGSFNVLWRKEQFRGTLGTACGKMAFAFQLDENNKYLTGNVRSDAFELGRAMDYPDIGAIACRAGFKIDISKPRTAKMRRVKGGKLPIGNVDALVYKAKYKFVTVTDIAAHIVSDGAVAEGHINMKGKLADVLCSFSFTNTDEMRKTKIKPGVRLNLFGKKEKGKKEEKKKEKKEKKEKEKKKDKDKDKKNKKQK